MRSAEPAPAGDVSVRPALRAAIFDLGGVVFRYREEHRLAGFARISGRSSEELRKRFLDSGYRLACDAGRLDADGAFREGLRLLGRRISMARFRDLWADAYEPDLEVVGLAAALKRRLPVALVSNNSQLAREGLERRHPDVLDLFRPRLFSADAGLLKPDPRLFRTVLQLMGQAASQTLYVDAEASHVAAAAALGFPTHHFTGSAGLEADLAARGLLS